MIREDEVAPAPCRLSRGRLSLEMQRARPPDRRRDGGATLQLYFFQAFVHLHNSDLVREFRPATLCFRILERCSSRFVGLPETHENILAFRLSVEDIATVSALCQHRR